MKVNFIKLASFSLVAILSLGNLQAKEGMWIPYLIAQLNADDMAAMGMEISAEDIYSVNKSSLKDAIVHFGGGCTAELISNKGLLLTNHHCGYGQIQKHSSLEHDYLKDGFWAMSGKEELLNPGLTAAIVKYMKDVTNEVLEGTTSSMNQRMRDSIIRINATAIVESNEDNYQLEIKPFAYGNQYILIAKEVFKDVRLVGAPPSSIGKYGADTDNWMWPRHTGDFSIFRVYADASNKPAEYSETNVPYTPVQHLKVNLMGAKEDDFTMMYGFPGSTMEYLPSNEITFVINEYDPARIAVRESLLEILDKKMRESDATRIQYASKYARISNSWKKWIGEVKGMKTTKAVERKQKLEREFVEAVNNNEEWKNEYGNVLPELMKLYDDRKPVMMQRYMFLETMYYGNELMRHIYGYRKLVSLYNEEKTDELKAAAEKKAEGLANFYKDYDAELDEKAMKALLPVFLNSLNAEELEDLLADLKSSDEESLNKFISSAYDKAPMLVDSEKWTAALADNPEKAIKTLMKSDVYKLGMAAWNYFIKEINPKTSAYQAEIDKQQAKYMMALSKVFPDRPFYPDANSTLRVAYGKVEGYDARDAVRYNSHTYLDGVMAKYIPGDYEFDLPAKLIELYDNKDYGQYADGDKMPVCFIASNHSTGGNSGSPVLNGRGELIGLNFDRTWEGTMSDYNYDVDLCRNIMVDIRYVLFIVDKFAGAGYLVEEMDLITEEPAKAVQLPAEVEAN